MLHFYKINYKFHNVFLKTKKELKVKILLNYVEI